MSDDKTAAKDLLKWQNKLLPWMVILPSILIIVFVFLATKQLNVFSAEINNYKNSELDKVFLKDSSLKIPMDIKKDEFTKLYVLSKMEEQLMNKRYSQGGALLLSRLYTKYLGFFTGMILAIVGSVFIISKLTEPSTNIDTTAKAFKVSVVSASPGIIFGLLGTSLMLSTILKQNSIDIKDVATYLNPGMYQTHEFVIDPVNLDTGDKKKDSVDDMMKASSPYKKEVK